MRPGAELPEALAELQSLKLCLQQTFALLWPLAEGGVETSLDDFLQTLVSRKELLDLKVENALLRGNRELATALQRELTNLDESFSAAISDLDPDRAPA